MDTSSSRPAWLPFIYVGECVIALLLGLFVVSCGVRASYVYPDNQLIAWALLLGAVLYMSAIGASSRMGVIFPAAVLGLFIVIAVTQKFSIGEWLCGAAWLVYISVGLGVFAYFRHRRQAWLLPAAAICALAALVAQLCYTPWKIWYIFDTLGLVLMLAETTCRSIAALCLGSYFYTDLVRKRLRATRPITPDEKA